MSLLAAVAAVALSTQQDLKPADQADLQCFAVSVVAAGSSEDPVTQAGLSSGAMFYYGRLSGRTPDVKWLEVLVAYIKTEPLAELEANADRCGNEMMAVGRAFTGASSHLAD